MRRHDPGSYVDWYRQGGYGFPRQALVDDFWTLISTAARTKRKQWEDDLASTHTEREKIKRQLRKPDVSEDGQFELSELDRHYFKHSCHRDGQIKDLEELLKLGEELVLLATYKFIELERNRVLTERFPHLDGKTLFDYRVLSREFPFLKTLYGHDAITELRLICNAIKHSGRVSSELAKCHPSWRQGQSLVNLRAAYERIAPFVGAYSVALLNAADDYADHIFRYAQSIANDA